MSVVRSQAQTFLHLAQRLRPHWRNDSNLPRRIQLLLTSARSFGARDRRLYRELIYTTLRFLPWVESWLDVDPARAIKIVAWLAAETRDTKAFRAEVSGDWPVMTALAERAQFLAADAEVLLPPWFRAHCPDVFAPAELEAQLRRAPLWLRLQTNAAGLEADLAAQGWRSRRSPVLDSAWQLLDEGDVTKTDAFRRGAFEVQDLGSQLVLESIGVEPGAHWLDACAGAGGKSLQLAQLLGPGGRIDAHDIRAVALAELRLRAARAGLKNLAITTRPPTGEYDGVLVDAPCSGSGTWRRSPHLKWTTSPATIASRAELQLSLLAQFSRHLRPGGRLVYATCSLSREENERVIAHFRATHSGFKPAPFARTFGFTPRDGGLTILPARHDTDGFFVASLQRK